MKNHGEGLNPFKIFFLQSVFTPENPIFQDVGQNAYESLFGFTSFFHFFFVSNHVLNMFSRSKNVALHQEKIAQFPHTCKGRISAPLVKSFEYTVAKNDRK